MGLANLLQDNLARPFYWRISNFRIFLFSWSYSPKKNLPTLGQRLINLVVSQCSWGYQRRDWGSVFSSLTFTSSLANFHLIPIFGTDSFSSPLPGVPEPQPIWFTLSKEKSSAGLGQTESPRCRMWRNRGVCFLLIHISAYIPTLSTTLNYLILLIPNPFSIYQHYHHSLLKFIGENISLV